MILRETAIGFGLGRLVLPRLAELAEFGPLAPSLRFFSLFYLCSLVDDANSMYFTESQPGNRVQSRSVRRSPPEPQLHLPPRPAPERRQTQCDAIFQSSCGTFLHPSLDFCGVRTIGLSPVDESCLRAIGSFVAIHGWSIPFLSPYSNERRFS